MSKQKYRIKYKLPNGMLYADRLIWAKDEHDATKIASNLKEEWMINDSKLCGIDYLLYVRNSKLIINIDQEK